MTKKTDKESDQAPSAPAVFDVSKPGETAASPTSRPIIVGHTSTLKQDPMVTPEKEEKPLKKKSEAVIAPITDEPKDESPAEEPTEESKDEEVTEDSAKEEPTEKPKEESSKKEEEKKDDETAETAAATSGSSEIDAVASEAGSKKQSKKDLEEETEEIEKLQEITNSKKYFLPIREGGKKRSGQIFLLWFLLISVIVVVAAWLVVDAGYYDPGFELPYDLIKQ